MRAKRKKIERGLKSEARTSPPLAVWRETFLGSVAKSACRTREGKRREKRRGRNSQTNRRVKFYRLSPVRMPFRSNLSSRLLSFKSRETGIHALSPRRRGSVLDSRERKRPSTFASFVCAFLDDEHRVAILRFTEGGKCIFAWIRFERNVIEFHSLLLFVWYST